jgi:membrane associated rhomboid family serine protease
MAVRPDAALAGASGAVWGVLASVVAWFILFGSHFPEEHVAELGRRLGFAVVVNVLVSLAPGVSWESHLGGAVAGFGIALLAHMMRPGVWWPTMLSAAVLVLLPLIGAVGLKRWMDRSNTWAPLRYRDEVRRTADRPPAAVRIQFPGYKQASDLFTAATAAWIHGSVEQTAAAHARAGEMKAEAVAARATLDSLDPPEHERDLVNRTRTYLDALQSFVQDVEDMTVPGGKPDVAAAVARGQRKHALEAAWKAMGGR